MSMRLPINPPLPRRRSRKRPDVATFIALLSLVGVIYLMETDLPMRQLDSSSSVNNAPPRRPVFKVVDSNGGGGRRSRMRGLTRTWGQESATKEMDEFAVWVAEAAESIAGGDEIKRQRVSYIYTC